MCNLISIYFVRKTTSETCPRRCCWLLCFFLVPQQLRPVIVGCILITNSRQYFIFLSLLMHTLYWFIMLYLIDKRLFLYSVISCLPSKFWYFITWAALGGWGCLVICFCYQMIAKSGNKKSLTPLCWPTYMNEDRQKSGGLYYYYHLSHVWCQAIICTNDGLVYWHNTWPQWVKTDIFHLQILWW